MREVTRQLERVRWASRILLVVQRLLQWCAAIEAVLLAAGVIDFGLRLPSWFRLVIGVGAVITALFWLFTRLARALAVRPELGALAQRAEQIQPELAGLLATGVEFSLHPDLYAHPQRTGDMAQASMRRLEQKLQSTPLRGLFNPVPTLQRLAMLLAVTLVLVGIAAAAPVSASIAFRRWFAPLGSAQWPRRTSIKSAVTQTIWPSDSPLRLGARIEKGYYPAMRTWLVYRFVSLNAVKTTPPWQSVLMNEQTASPIAARGAFERLLDMPDWLRPGNAVNASASAVEFYFEAGDDQTAVQTIALVDRPALRATRLAIEPPAYARGLVNPQDVDLDQQSSQIATATALVGSRVRWILDLNKPLPRQWIVSNQFMPGINGTPGLTIETRGLDAQSAPAAPQNELAMDLKSTLQSSIHLPEEYGLTNLSDRLYRVEATVDQPPAVSMTLPVSDETVLSTARVPLEAVAQDDVGVESVELQAQAMTRDKSAAASPAATTALSPPATVARTTGRAARLTVAHQMDLAAMALNPGDEVDVLGIARDVYELEGLRHDPVRSAPRRLRVIDAAAFSSAIWNDLQGVRDQAMRLESDQHDLAAARVAQALAGQQEMARRIDTQANLVRALTQRVADNRLNDAALGQVLARAAQLLQKGTAASQAAATKLEEARRDPVESESPRAQAQEKQHEVEAALAALVGALDQGRDTTAAELQLRALVAQLAAVNGDIRQALPRTLGKSPDQLTPEESKRINDLADRQTALQAAADALVRSMDAAAASLSGSKDPQQQATAQALSDAASTAKSQDLSSNMESAAQSAKANRLADASSADDASQATMQNMLNQLGNQEQRQQEVLRRQFAALTEAVQKLIEQEKTQIDVLDRAVEVRPLDQPQVILRQNTLAVEFQARTAQDTSGAVQSLDLAGDHQADAISALRQARKETAGAGEKLALTSLEAALARLQRRADQAKARRSQEAKLKLKEQYDNLAKEQDELQGKTQALIDTPGLDRRQRADLIDLGHHEADLQAAIDVLRDQVSDAVLFVHLHQPHRRDRRRRGHALRARRPSATFPWIRAASLPRSASWRPL